MYSQAEGGNKSSAYKPTLNFISLIYIQRLCLSLQTYQIKFLSNPNLLEGVSSREELMELMEALKRYICAEPEPKTNWTHW